MVTLNDPQFIEAARHLAQQALTVSGGDDAKVIDYIAQRVLCRPIDAREREIVLTSKDELYAYYRSKPDDARALTAIGESKADGQLDISQLAAWTMVCNQIMNLDEALNK